MHTVPSAASPQHMRVYVPVRPLPFTSPCSLHRQPRPLSRHLVAAPATQKVGDETYRLKGDLCTLSLICLQPTTPGSRASLSPSQGCQGPRGPGCLSACSGSGSLTLLPFTGRFLATSLRLRAGRANGNLGGTSRPQGTPVVLGDLGGRRTKASGVCTWDSERRAQPQGHGAPLSLACPLTSGSVASTSSASSLGSCLGLKDSRRHCAPTQPKSSPQEPLPEPQAGPGNSSSPTGLWN